MVANPVASSSVAAGPQGGGRTAIAATLPGTLDQIVRLTRFQFRDYLRSRRFILMFAIVGVIGLILTSVVGYFRPAFISDPLAFYGSLWGGGVPFVVVLAAVIYGADAIAGEFQNKTGYFLMGLPIRRITVYTGKFIAAFLASLAAVALFAAILVANGAYYLGGNALPWQLGESFILAVVYLLAVLAAAMMFSSMFKTSSYATLLVALLFLIGFSLLQAVVSGLANITPWFVITYANTIIGGVLSNSCENQPGMHTCKVGGGPGGGFSITVNNATIPEGAAIMIAYFLLTAVAGIFLFEREEFS
ncbi:MAG: ABC transporter permease [Thermoplasmata archaeon]|nr:ABC transporter permease [Thermoplasmata archaeon]